MHFGHPKTITAFKNQNCLKIWGFQGVPHTRWGNFGLTLDLKISKTLQKIIKEWWKMKEIWKIFKNILNFPRIHFGHPKTITAFKNRNFLKICVFQGVPHTRLGNFGLILDLKISKALQKIVKEWWKNEKNLKIFQKYSKLPQNAFWAS